MSGSSSGATAPRTPPYRRAAVPAALAGATVAAACVELGLVADDAEFALRLDHGGVWADQWRVADGAQPAVAEQTLTVHFPPGDQYATLEMSADWLVDEDEFLVILNKPPGAYVGVTPWDIHGNVQAALRRALLARDGVVYPIHLAHQLDRDTSGVLVVSKHPSANAPLQRVFAGQLVTKRYLALAQGRVEPAQFTVETGHGRGAHGLFRTYPLEQVGETLLGKQRVKYMATAFAVEQRFTDATLLHAAPQTGRTHQIWLHLHGRRHPILGDARYGGPLVIGDLALHHHLLHAEQLTLQHPLTRSATTWNAPLPPLFRAALAQSRGARQAGRPLEAGPLADSLALASA